MGLLFWITEPYVVCRHAKLIRLGIDNIINERL